MHELRFHWIWWNLMRGFVYDLKLRGKFTMATVKFRVYACNITYNISALTQNEVRAIVSIFLFCFSHCNIIQFWIFLYFLSQKNNKFWYSFLLGQKTTPHPMCLAKLQSYTMTMTLTSYQPPTRLLLRLFIHFDEIEGQFEYAAWQQKLFHQLCIKLWIFLLSLWRFIFFPVHEPIFHLKNNLFFER